MPEMSQLHVVLIENLGKSITSREMLEYLEEIQAPPSLKGLFPVSRRILEVIDLIHVRDMIPARKAMLRRVAAAIVENPEVEIDGYRVQPSSETPGSFRGLYADHPLYCVYVHACVVPTLRRQYAVLVAAFLAAFSGWAPNVEDRCYLLASAGRAVRRMGDFTWSPDGGDPVRLMGLEIVLRNLSVSAMSADQLAQYFKRAAKEILDLGGHQIEYVTLTLLGQVFAGEVPPVRGEVEYSISGKSTAPGQSIVGGFQSPWSVIVAVNPGAVQEIQVSFLGTGGTKGDGSRAETGQFKSPPDIELIIPTEKPRYSTRDDYLLILANRHRCEALALDAQNFVFAQDMLNAFDIRTMMASIQGSLEKNEIDSGCIYILLVLFAGLPRAQLLCLKWSRKKRQDTSMGAYILLKSSAIHVRTYSAQSHMRLPADREWRVTHDSEFQIRLPPKVIQALLAYLQTTGGEASEGMLFVNPDAVISEGKIRLESLNIEHGTRLTLNRLENFRYAWITNYEDEGHAILAGGYQSDQHYEPLTYSAVNHTALDEDVRRVTNLIADVAGLDRTWHIPQGRGINQEEGITAGSRLAAKLTSITEYAQQCLSKVDEANTGKRGQLDTIACHNAFVEYCYGCVVTGLGMRPVTHPFPHENLISTDGWAILTDKDNDQYYHSRLLELPEIIRMQLEELVVHNRLMAQRLLVIGWKAGKELVRGEPIRMGSRSECLTINDKNPRLFFKLDAQGNRQPMAPSVTLRALCDMGLEVNSARHAFRSELRHRRCLDQQVRAWMGHWRLGEEPYGALSCMDPVMAKQAARKWVEPYIQEMGWQFLSSPFRRS